MPSHEVQTWINAGGIAVLLLLIPMLIVSIAKVNTRLGTYLESGIVRREEFEALRAKVELIAERQSAVLSILRRNGLNPEKN